MPSLTTPGRRKETFRHFGFARTNEEEQAASAKAVGVAE